MIRLTSQRARQRARHGPARLVVAPGSVRPWLLTAVLCVPALVAAGCRAAPTTGVPPTPTIEANGSSALVVDEPVADELDVGDRLPVEQMVGRIIVVADDIGGPTVVSAHEPSTGGSTVLWSTAAGSTMEDWLVSPDGARVAYIVRGADSASGPGSLELVARDLRAGASPEIVASAEPTGRWPAGIVWSPDGGTIAYGSLPSAGAQPSAAGVARADESYPPPAAQRPLGLGFGYPGPGAVRLDVAIADLGSGDTEETSAARSESHDSSAAPDTAASSSPNTLTAPGHQPLSIDLQHTGYGGGAIVAGWAPELERVAVVQAAPDGGSAGTVLLVDLETGATVSQKKIDVRPQDLALSPDGRLLAVTDPTGTRRRVTAYRTETGEEVVLADLETGWLATTPVWSSDGSWLAWTEFADELPIWEGTTARASAVRVGDYDEGTDGTDGTALEKPDLGTPLKVAVEGRTARAVGFSPDGSMLLVAVAGTMSPEDEYLSAYLLADGHGGPLGWELPPGTWHVDWVPYSAQR